MILLVLVVLLNGTAIASSSGDMRGTEGTYVQTSMTFDTLACRKELGL